MARAHPGIRSAPRGAAMLLACLLPALAWTVSSAESRDETLAGPVSLAGLLHEADALRSAEPERFARLLEDVVARAQELGPRERHHLAFLQAYRLAFSGRYREAIEASEPLRGDGVDPVLRFRAGLLMANSHAVLREFGDGLRELEQALSLQASITDRAQWHDGLIVAALLYNQLGQYEDGMLQAARVLADDPAPRARCFAGHLRLESLSGMGRGLGGAEGIRFVVEDCQAQGERIAANLSRVYLARELAASGLRGDAITLLRQHLDEVRAIGYPQLLAEVHARLAEFLLGEGDLARARRHARETLDAGQAIGGGTTQVVAHRVLHEVALAEGDLAQALAEYRRYAEADKAQLDAVQARELAVQRVRNELQAKNQTIALLNSRNEVLELEQALATREAANTRLLAGALGTLLFLLLLWSWRARRMHRTLKQLAETDALTGVCNRRHFGRLLADALVEASRSRRHLALVSFDLDNFKAINDGHGHATGDWVLRSVALACMDGMRKGDTIGRIGGEEFAILLPDCDAEAAAVVAESHRRRIAAIDCRDSGAPIQVTASFGVTATPLSGHAADRMLQQADEAMYRSKANGRDRVSIYRPAPDGPDLTRDGSIARSRSGDGLSGVTG